MSLSIIKPTVGGDSGSWGSKLNTALDAIVTAVNANITDIAARLSLAGGALTGRLDVKTATMAHVALASAGAQGLDLAAAQSFATTATGNTSFAFNNTPATGMMGFVLFLTNGGAFTMSWPAGVKWPSGSQPALTVAGLDVLVFLSRDGGATWDGTVAIKDAR